MTDEFPPFGGENLPPRELDKEKIASIKIKGKNFLVIGLLVVVAFLLGIIALLLVMSNNKKAVPVISSPSPIGLQPSPVSTQSGLPTSINQRLDELEKSLGAIDFSQTKFLFPIIDFEIVFEKNR